MVCIQQEDNSLDPTLVQVYVEAHNLSALGEILDMPQTSLQLPYSILPPPCLSHTVASIALGKIPGRGLFVLETIPSGAHGTLQCQGLT